MYGSGLRMYVRLRYPYVPLRTFSAGTSPDVPVLRGSRARATGWSRGPRSYFARSKSIALYARSLLSRCSDVICRTVPDLERMTIDSVVATSAR